MNKVTLWWLTACCITSCGLSVHAQSWDKQINTVDRFKILSQFQNEAVLDKETGLVWQRSPDEEWQPYDVAAWRCNYTATGGRRGWRLPTIQELASLVDPTKNDLALPERHPFQNVVGTYYWSGTTHVTVANAAWVLEFSNGGPDPAVRTDANRYWCVRSGQGIDTQ